MLKLGPYGTRPDPGLDPAAPGGTPSLIDAVPLPTDLRLLLDVADRHFAARLAMELFCFRLASNLDALCAATEGTGPSGVGAPAASAGERSPRAGSAIHAHLARLGLAIDAARRCHPVATAASTG